MQNLYPCSMYQRDNHATKPRRCLYDRPPIESDRIQTVVSKCQFPLSSVAAVRKDHYHYKVVYIEGKFHTQGGKNVATSYRVWVSCFKFHRSTKGVRSFFLYA